MTSLKQDQWIKDKEMHKDKLRTAHKTLHVLSIQKEKKAQILVEENAENDIKS